MNCPQCQQVLRETARFCDGCGHAVTAYHTPTERMDAAALAPALAGRVLDGKYELLARLGAGGMGAVYRARRVHIGDEVAVKVLHPQFVADAQSVERFRREARATAVLRHPNVVTIHDFGEARGDEAPAYIVMELVEGASLRDLLRREGRLAAARAVALMRDVCAGVGAGHRRGVVHRDLKPDNVIVLPPDAEGARETVKVVDFGIAKLRDAAGAPALTQTGAIIGTPYYMSPEQCRGESLDARADVYSLGAMLYELLAATPPFNAESITGVVAKHLTEPPPPLPADVPAALSAVCLRALAKRPDDRPADAHALARELQAALTPDAATQAGDAAAQAAPFVVAPPAVATPATVSAPYNVAAQTPATVSAQVSVPTLPREAHAPPPSDPSARRPSRAKWLVAGLLALLVVGVVVSGAAFFTSLVGGRKTAVEVDVKSPTNADAVNEQVAVEPPGDTTDNTAAGDTPAAPAAGRGLTGKWTGTYGPMNQPATLTVEEHRGDTFSGVLEQGAVRVAFTGRVNAARRGVTIKETRVLSGDGWSLGEGTGTLSQDGRSMSGTGQDPTGAQFGMSYQWSFTKQ
ncbi:MAG TPA: protein kinase [Pyrinomonadaceae bacterium]|jgi:serine/threonine-protein kinase